MAGIKPGSIPGLITRGVVPPADAKVGRTLVWHADTATEWLERRPGPGKPWAGTLPEGNPDKATAILAEWVTVKQLADRLGTTARNVTDRVARGTLPAPDGQIGRALIWHVSRIPT